MLIWERHLESQILTEEDSSELSDWYNFFPLREHLAQVGMSGHEDSWILFAHGNFSIPFAVSVILPLWPSSIKDWLSLALFQVHVTSCCVSVRSWAGGRWQLLWGHLQADILKQLLQSPDSCYVTKQGLPLYIRQRRRERKGLNF